jgi:predicted DNA repair protein MutK
MKLLALLGTVAMFLVGGGILAHGLPFIHELTHSFEAAGALVAGVANAVTNIVLGVLAGIVVLVVVSLGGKLFKSNPKKH